MSVILCMSGPITVGASTGSLGEDIIGTTTGGIGDATTSAASRGAVASAGDLLAQWLSSSTAAKIDILYENNIVNVIATKRKQLSINPYNGDFKSKNNNDQKVFNIN